VIPEDNEMFDWIGKYNKRIVRFTLFGVTYQGFEHYSEGGESIFNFYFAEGVLSGNEVDDNTEEILRRHLQHSENDSSQEGEGAE
ncbi:MAG: hypothetical protein L3J56_00940, partial [Bacteroidales bacterium]|nr:hypothetical protein [Bacteroidales bacterium]